MSKEEPSYRQILRSSAIIGGSSVVSVGVVLIRTKLAALLLGPAGIGLIGLFNGVVSTAASIAGMGINSAGTRQIAQAASEHDGAAIAAARRALFWATLALGTLGAACMWLMRRQISVWVSGDAGHAREIGWLGIAVALTVAASSQTALINGMREIGNLARINVLGAVAASVLGMAAIWVWRERGILAFVLAAPAASCVLGHVFVARLPRIAAQRTPLRALADQWSALLRIGVSFMLSGLAGTGAQLFVRTAVQRQLGAEPLGYFQAASTMATTYLSFVLGAMGTDFYPRLTGAIRDHERANRLVNEQTEVMLLMAGPIVLAMLALAPWLTTVLYSASFAQAVEVLRWQVLGDVLRVASWPLAFVIMAAGDGRTFLLCETAAMGSFAALSFAGLPYVGVQAAGMAFPAMYVLYLPLVYVLGHRRTGFRWSRSVAVLFAILLGGSLAIFAVAKRSELWGAILGCTAAAFFAIYALARIAKMSDLRGVAARIQAKLTRRTEQKQ